MLDKTEETEKYNDHHQAHILKKSFKHFRSSKYQILNDN